MTIRLIAASAALLCTSLVAGDTLVATTVLDNTLIEDPDGAFSAGAATSFYAGRVGTNGNGTLRRGVIKFDLSAIPAGSTIQSVTITLYCSKVGLGSQFPVAFKRLTASFGEGTSVAFGGGGASSTADDATWLHRFYPGIAWATPGGDFVATTSAVRNVGGTGFYTWNSTAQLVADVQGWVDQPSTHFGWLVQGNETTLQSVKRFDTRESIPAFRPKITVVYTPPAPLEGDLNGDGKVDAADLAILLGQWGGAGSADLNGSGAVDAADLAVLLGAWTG
jgi:hypothetical protein